MKNKILLLLLCFFIGCKQNAQKYNYELADSNESYIMDNWDDAQKEDYYNKVGNLVSEFLLREHKFSQDIYDVKSDKTLPTKTWINKYFENILFENVSYDFIENLKL